MTSSVRAFLERHANWKTATAAIVACVASVVGLVWRQGQLPGQVLLDSRFWYTPDEAAALFASLDQLDAGARSFVATTGMTIDLLFPLAYGLLFAILLVKVYQSPIYLLALGTMVADILENSTVAILALSYDGGPSGLTWLAACFTLTKAVLFNLSILMIVIGTILVSIKRLRNRSSRE